MATVPSSLAEEAGVVLQPGNGFEVVDLSARVSLANLTDVEYTAIASSMRQILDEYYDEFTVGALTTR